MSVWWPVICYASGITGYDWRILKL